MDANYLTALKFYHVDTIIFSLLHLHEVLLSFLRAMT